MIVAAFQLMFGRRDRLDWAHAEWESQVATWRVRLTQWGWWVLRWRRAHARWGWGR